MTAGETRRPGLFLDRDGVINVDTDYVSRIDEFVFHDGVFDLVRHAHEAGFLTVVVTNQSGLARGLFTENDYETLTAWMIGRFEAQGAPIGKIYHCPFLPAAPVARYSHDNHPWRKPNPGMFIAAEDDLSIDLSRSVMIGDRWSDAAAAAAAGLGRIALVGARADEEPMPAGLPPVARLSDLREALAWFDALTRTR